MSDNVTQIKERISIEEVVGGYVKLMRAGGSLKGRCPFHNEKTPSFVVSPDRGNYHCFGCGVHGDIFTFVEEMEGVDFKGALKILADKAGVELTFKKGDKGTKDQRDRLFEVMEETGSFFQKILMDRETVVKYLTDRGLSEDTIDKFNIGFAMDEWHTLHNHLKEKGFADTDIEKAGLIIKGEKGYYDRFRSRIMFPIWDSAGRIVAFTGRVFGGDEKTAKYVNSPETDLYHKSKILYGFDKAKQTIRKNNFSILVEGQMDLIAVHQAGYTNAVAISGTALTEDHIKLLSRLSKNIVMALDGDKAGINAVEKSAKLALQNNFDVKVAVLPDGKDPADVIQDEGVDEWKKITKDAKHVVEFFLNLIKEKNKDDSRLFKKGVEAIVIPLILKIQSPIDKDHFIGITADKLGVSNSTILEAMSGEQHKQEQDINYEMNVEDEFVPVSNYEMKSLPENVLMSILFWQEASKKARLDIDRLKKDLENLFGNKRFEKAHSLKESFEALVFETESVYKDEDLQVSVDALLGRVRLKKIEQELTSIMQKLDDAEKDGDNKLITECEKEQSELLKKINKIKHQE